MSEDLDIVDAEIVEEHRGVIELANPLDEREAAVVRLVGEGKGLEEVAEELDIGVKAVQGYLRRAMLKMEAGRFRLPDRAVRSAGRATPQHDPLRTVSPETEAQRRRGIPQNTIETKTYQWLRYVDWCGGDGEDASPVARDPIDDDPERAVTTVRDWIQANWRMTRIDEQGRVVGRGRNGQPYAPDTVRLSLAVISMAYQRKGLAAPTHHPDAIEQMRGYHRDWKNAGYRPDRAYALTTEESHKMIRACDLTTAAGLRDAALMRLADDTGRRNVDLLSINWTDITWESDNSFGVSFPHNKTYKDDGKDDDRPILIEADTDLAPDICPVLLMHEWMQLCAARLGEPLKGPVFREVNSGTRRKDGTHSGRITANRMTRKAFQDVVAKYAKITKVDREPRTGRKRKVVPHSFRVKFASESELYGVPENAVADRAGWVRGSRSMRMYMRLGSGRGANNPAVAIRKAIAGANKVAENIGIEGASGD